MTPRDWTCQPLVDMFGWPPRLWEADACDSPKWHYGPKGEHR